MSTMTDGEGGVNRGARGLHGFDRRCALKRGMCPTSGAHEHAGPGEQSAERGAGDVALTVNAPCACLERGVSESLSSKGHKLRWGDVKSSQGWFLDVVDFLWRCVRTAHFAIRFAFLPDTGYRFTVISITRRTSPGGAARIGYKILARVD